MRIDPRDMPPDPFAEVGIDQMALEHAEELARHPADSASAEWDRFDGPTTDEFDDAEQEIAELEDGANGSDVPVAMLKAGMAAVAVVVIIAMLVLFVF